MFRCTVNADDSRTVYAVLDVGIIHFEGMDNFFFIFGIKEACLDKINNLNLNVEA